MDKPLPSALPQPLVFHRRRWTAMLALPIAFVIAVSGIWFAFAAYQSFEGGLGIALSALGLLTGAGAISVGKACWDGVVQTAPALTVDARGITDAFHLRTFLPWSDIAAATVDYGDGDSLVISLREGAPLPSGKPVRPSLSRLAKRAFNGGDLAIPLGSLRYDHRQLRASLKHYVAQHRQAR
jgi:hypothetical protein